MSRPDRSDKFTYTDPRQIKIIKRGDRSEHLQQLRDLIEQEHLDPSKVLTYVRENKEQFR